jgi:hypothetical protein
MPIRIRTTLSFFPFDACSYHRVDRSRVPSSPKKQD